MRSPYGLELVESCQGCSQRLDGFFCQLPTTTLKAFEVIKFTTTYPGGAVLFVEGESTRGVHLLCKGRVKLSITSADGKTLILRIAKPGEILGLHAAISGTPYHATAEALEPCQINFVKREDFLRFLAQNAQASIHAAQQLSNNYQTACEQVRSLGLSHSAPEKLATFLLEWSVSGQKTKDGIRAKLTLTHEEIGQIIGSSRETVTRTLAQFKAQQWATLKGSTLLIQNKEKLESLAGV
jgi:CRP/FNR family transcriptional regulator, cyclic AMP receptor protein